MTRPPVRRPAAYVRDYEAAPGDESDLAEARNLIVGSARELGWPEPVVYADAGAATGPGSQYAALTEAIAAGHHDAVIIAHPMMISRDLAQIEAFDKLCRQQFVRVHSRWGYALTDPRLLFDVIRNTRRFTVTEEHLRLLRRAHVGWDETEFGAPEISCKRPYGNSNVYADIAEILEIPDDEWCYELEPFPEAQWRFLRLHVETGVVLQIALATGEFRVGRYVREDDWRVRWRREDPITSG